MGLLGEALKNIARKPDTRRYPAEKPEVPFNLRGKVVHLPDRCIYCGLCQKYCPSHAITVDIPNRIWRIDYGRCLFCQQCEEVCRDMIKKNAIKLSSVYELAEKDKKRLVYEDKGKIIVPGQKKDEKD
jgi:formate hydrogenlyase subunit 6/NADH:ubiquinone oxidoreductase subunit I